MNHLIVDGFNLAFRSHFAFSQFTTKAGVPSGCVYGFMVTMRSLKTKNQGFHLTIAWDHEARRKKEAFTEYKANRPRFDIGERIRDIKSTYSFMNVSQCECIGEEADDVMATLARKYSEEGLVYVYSSDKDLLQLVQNGKVILIRPRPSKDAGLQAYDEEAVKEEFGVSPMNLPCFLAMRGDAVDNIPGVARVPSKVLAMLSEKYGDPWNIYSHIESEKFTDFQKFSIKNFESQAYVNYGLVKLRNTLDTDPETSNFFKLSMGASNIDQVKTYLDKYEIKSVSADRYTDMFTKESSFLEKESPAIKNFSLFE